MKRGDIVQLGPHRLMCGDSTDERDVQNLTQGRADLILTSPPYASQRKYKGHPWNFTDDMTKAFAICSYLSPCQAVVNLGNVHRRGEYIEYWQDWKTNIREFGWKHHGLYIWYKMHGVPGDFSGRPRPAYEMLFHFSHKQAFIRKTVQCTYQQQGRTRFSFDNRNTTRPHLPPMKFNATRAPDNVFLAHREGAGNGHPAKAPVSLFAQLIKAFCVPGGVAYDPFSGSGTIIVASEQEGAKSLAMEIEPSYCDMAIERYRKIVENRNKPSKPKRKVVTA